MTTFENQPDVGGFAYATMCLKDSDVPGALALIASVNLTDTEHEFIVLVGPNVTPGCKELLEKANKTTDIKHIEVNCKKLQSIYRIENKTDGYKSSFNILHLLNCDNYDKILFISSNAILMTNVDHLFELNTPAATFESADAITRKPYGCRKLGNDDLHFTDYDTKHGSVITSEQVEHNLTHINKDGISGYVCNDKMLLLSPSKDDFNNIMNILETNTPFGFASHNPGIVHILAYYYSMVDKMDWTNIHQKFNFRSDKLVYLDAKYPCGSVQFGSPWESKCNTYGKTLSNLEIIWWKMFKRAIDHINFDVNVNIFKMLAKNFNKQDGNRTRWSKDKKTEYKIYIMDENRINDLLGFRNDHNFANRRKIEEEKKLPKFPLNEETSATRKYNNSMFISSTRDDEKTRYPWMKHYLHLIGNTCEDVYELTEREQQTGLIDDDNSYYNWMSFVNNVNRKNKPANKSNNRNRNRNR